jgi:hypothetical protein
MAEATQYSFALLEVAETLIKKQGIHEGKWLIAIEFTLNVGLMGAVAPDVKPGVMVLANSVQLLKAQDGSPPNLTIDASVVNPKPRKEQSKK